MLKGERVMSVFSFERGWKDQVPECQNWMLFETTWRLIWPDNGALYVAQFQHGAVSLPRAEVLAAMLDLLPFPATVISARRQKEAGKAALASFTHRVASTCRIDAGAG